MPDIAETETVLGTGERTTSTGNPLRDAIRGLVPPTDPDAEAGEEDAEPDAGEQDEEEESESTDVVESESESDEEAEEEAEEAPEDEESDEDKGDKKPKKTPKLSSVEILMPNADGSQGPRGTGKITLEGVPQEAADAIRHYQKAAGELPLVKERLAVSEKDAAIADFIEKNPLDAMVIIDHSRPEVTTEFVKLWLQMNPTAIPALIKELELDELDDKSARIMAKGTKTEARQKAFESASKHKGDYGMKQRVDDLLQVPLAMAQQAGIKGDDYQDFMVLAGRKMAAAFKQNNNLSQRDVALLLQSTVARYVGTAATPKPKKNPTETAKSFTTKVDKSKKFKVVGGGHSQVSSASGTPEKFPRGTTLQEAINQFKGKKPNKK